jgi:3-oxoacyl-[acyl-carrier protein] reductase
MDLGLQGKVALVTAASTGLGLAVARTLAAEGAHLAICARRPAPLEEAAAAIRAETSSEVLAIAADVSLPDEVSRFVEDAAAHFGRIDILVINAGGPPPGEFADLNEAAWRRGVDLTLMSAVNLCYAAVPHMSKTAGGRIIAITSLTVKQPSRNLILSNSVRMAVVGLMKSLSIELAPQGILVNSVLPGWTQTDRVVQLLSDRASRLGASIHEVESEIVNEIPLGRMGKPEEFAALVAFLSSERASYITGSAIAIDGGSIKSSL